MDVIDGKVARLLIFCLIIEIFYLVLANITLGSGILETLLNRRPDKYKYTWTRAWSIVPGVVHVRDFQIWNRSRSTTWTLSIDKARFRVIFWALPLRTIRIYRLKASGVDIDIERPRPLPQHSEPENSLKERNFLDQQISRHNPTESKVIRPGWRIDIRSADFDNVRSMKFDEYFWNGTGRIQGQLNMVVRDVLAIPKLMANLQNGQVVFQNKTIADNLQTQTNLKLNSFIPRQNPGAAFLDCLEGNLAVAGGAKNLDFLAYYIKNIDWLAVHGGGQIRTSLFFDNGFLSEKSHLLFESDDLSVKMKGWMFQGSGVIDGIVRKTDDDLESVLRLELKEVAVCHDCRNSEMVSLPDIHMVFKGKNIELTKDTPQITAELSISETDIDDLSVFNRLFPLNSGFEILPDGQGTIAAHIEINSELSQAELRLSGKKVGLSLGGQIFSGDCQFSAIMQSGDPALRHIHLKNTELVIDNMRHSHQNTISPETWRASIIIPDTEMIWDDIIQLSSEVHISLSHSQALTDIFMGRKNHWFEDLIHFENIRGRAQLQLDSSGLNLYAITLIGDGMLAKEFGIKPFTVYSASSQANLNNGFSNLHIQFRIPDSTIPDVSIIDDYLPHRSGFSIFPGSAGRIQADVDIQNGIGKSTLIISGSKTEFSLLDTRFRGDVEFRIVLDTRDMLSGRFDVANTLISLEHVVLIDANDQSDWWSRLEVSHGELVFGKPITFSGRLKLQMRDTCPILAVFEDKNRVVAWLGDIILIENIYGDGFFRINREGLGIDTIDLKGERLEIKAKLHFSLNRKIGILYVNFHGLSMGIEMQNGNRNYKFIHPRRWFDRYSWNQASVPGSGS